MSDDINELLQILGVAAILWLFLGIHTEVFIDGNKWYLGFP